MRDREREVDQECMGSILVLAPEETQRDRGAAKDNNLTREAVSSTIT